MGCGRSPIAPSSLPIRPATLPALVLTVTQSSFDPLYVNGHNVLFSAGVINAVGSVRFLWEWSDGLVQGLGAEDQFRSLMYRSFAQPGRYRLTVTARDGLDRDAVAAMDLVVMPGTR